MLQGEAFTCSQECQDAHQRCIDCGILVSGGHKHRADGELCRWVAQYAPAEVDDEGRPIKGAPRPFLRWVLAVGSCFDRALLGKPREQNVCPQCLKGSPGGALCSSACRHKYRMATDIAYRESQNKITAARVRRHRGSPATAA